MSEEIKVGDRFRRVFTGAVWVVTGKHPGLSPRWWLHVEGDPGNREFNSQAILLDPNFYERLPAPSDPIKVGDRFRNYLNGTVWVILRRHDEKPRTWWAQPEDNPEREERGNESWFLSMCERLAPLPPAPPKPVAKPAAEPTRSLVPAMSDLEKFDRELADKEYAQLRGRTPARSRAEEEQIAAIRAQMTAPLPYLRSGR